MYREPKRFKRFIQINGAYCKFTNQSVIAEFNLKVEKYKVFNGVEYAQVNTSQPRSRFEQ
jgi:hypothetical protein